MPKIMLTDGGEVEAVYVRHLRTLTPTSSFGGHNIDVDLYRLSDGRLVVTRWPDDARVLPCVDPESSPADYGVGE